MSKPPERVVARVEQRIREHIQKKWSARVESFSVRSRASFVYVDVRFAGDEELKDEDGPQPLFRLRYLGSEEGWEFAFFSWSRGINGSYELSYLNNGQPVGTPEACFDCAAFVWQ